MDFKIKNKYLETHRTTEILTVFCHISSSQFTILFLGEKHEDIITLPFGKTDVGKKEKYMQQELKLLDVFI